MTSDPNSPIATANGQVDRVQSTAMPRSLCVVLDTNVWLNSNLLRSDLGAALTYYLLKMSGRIGLPEVVELELNKHIPKKGAESVQKVTDNLSIITKLVGKAIAFQPLNANEFEARMRDRLTDLDELLIRIPFTHEHAKAALRRVIDDLPPNGEKNQQYKDSAIWEAVLELAKTYQVVFVTEDKGFFQDREPTRGLAHNLAEDVKVLGGGISVYPKLERCLAALRKDVPKLDYRELGDRIQSMVLDEVEGSAVRYSLQIVGHRKSEVKAFLTENKYRLALTFETLYDAIVIPPSEIEKPPIVTVMAEGGCSYDLGSDVILDVKLEFLRLLAPSGAYMGGTTYLRGSMGPRREVPFTLRSMLDDMD